MTTKILVAGDVKGSIDQLFARVGTLHASKGPFDCLLCVGDFFGTADAAELLTPFKSGTQSPPLRTYILGPAPPGSPEPDADGKVELAPDLFFLTGAGIVTLHALRVGFASARSSSLVEAVADLRGRASEAGFAGCDLLLTHEWPRGFHQQLPAEGGLPPDLLPERDLPTVGAELVAELAATVRPRYHFCGTEDAFFQRAPYRAASHPPAANLPPPTTTISRLITLASVGADKKKKWLHALSLVPCSQMSSEQLAAAPENTTESPYPYAPPLPPPLPEAASASAEGGGDGGGGGNNKGKRKREFTTDSRTWVHESCWFCMASPQFESHFVVSVGEEAYVATPKGPLLPMHALILPIAHIPCSLELSDAQAAEMASYVAALRKLFEARGAALLLFERYMGSGSFEHMHLQALPIPSQLAQNARQAFEAHGQRLGIHFEVLPPGETAAKRLADSPEPFFAATLPSGETLLHRLSANKSGRRHPLHFGREVVARMLGNPRLADWKACLPQPAPGERASTQELEKRMAEDFKAAFAMYDPAAEA